MVFFPDRMDEQKVVDLNKNTYTKQQMDVSENRGYPQIIHFKKVFHYFHHPFWGTLIFGNTQMGQVEDS